MKLLSWNLNARRRCLGDQVAAIAARRPDVVALQEVTTTTVVPLRRKLIERGFLFVVSSFELMPAQAARHDRLGLILASRHPLVPVLHPRFEAIWPRHFLSAELRAARTVVVNTTHVPPGASHVIKKLEVLESIYTLLARRVNAPRILCGDFNTPQAETRDGCVVTWGQSLRSDGSPYVWRTWRGVGGERWDAAERKVLCGLARFDLVDVFRTLNGHRNAYSWYTNHRGSKQGRRYDHVFASRSLSPRVCVYLHRLRRRGLSDHSPVEAVFDQ